MASKLLASLIALERVIPWLPVRDVRHVVHALIRVATADTRLDREMLRRTVLDHGEISCFGYGRGVAVPHALIRGLEQPIGAFARLKPAQDFGAADEIPADLVFLLLSPEGDDPTHLRALACVARRLRDREVAARARSAKDAEAIHVVLTSDAWREPDDEPQTGHSATRPASDLTNRAMWASIEASC